MQQRRLFDDVPQNHGLIGRSPQIRGVLRTIEKLRNDTSTVLITGESGVGKELVARALHRVSRLAENKFLAVNSASLVGSLMDSELFGHERGAFTGAVNSKPGLVAAADGGTLFLDEIGELTPDVQGKLLRLLQEREIRPVGSTNPIQVKVRVLAATNRNLAREVDCGTFREDLFYRLNVISIHVPALRERRLDIPLLVEHFLQKTAPGKITLSDEAMRRLMKYDWPGNVRELENTICRLVALKSDPIVQVHDLPPCCVAPVERAASLDRNSSVLPLAEVEKQHILRAVEYTNGDVVAAANMLGIGKTTLYRKLKDYRGDPPEKRSRRNRLIA